MMAGGGVFELLDDVALQIRPDSELRLVFIFNHSHSGMKSAKYSRRNDKRSEYCSVKACLSMVADSTAFSSYSLTWRYQYDQTVSFVLLLSSIWATWWWNPPSTHAAMTDGASSTALPLVIRTMRIILPEDTRVILGGGRIFVSVCIFPHKWKVVHTTVRTTIKQKIWPKTPETPWFLVRVLTWRDPSSAQMCGILRRNTTTVVFWH